MACKSQMVPGAALFGLAQKMQPSAYNFYGIDTLIKQRMDSKMNKKVTETL